MSEKLMREAVNRFFSQFSLRQAANDAILYKLQEESPFGRLTTLHYQMFGGQSDEICRAAVAVEFMILALDIFDDLEDMDNDEPPWCNIEESLAMNLATGFLVCSVQLLEECDFPEERKARARSFFQKLVLEAVNGQHADLLNNAEDESAYVEMVRQKSGSLAALACVVGTALATEEHHERAKQFGTHLGVAAQMTNDMNDLLNWKNKNDAALRKRTLPFFYIQQGSPFVPDVLRQFYEEDIDMDMDMDSFVEAMKSSGALTYAKAVLHLEQSRAIEVYRPLHLSEEAMESLSKYVYYRGAS
ncbi:polyprenyl synthetase family protein [Aureibacillus halotolerans]|uniref:Competence protein ComQ n=1 Tax=Aureibacillus halotolerans TaxID=1508390 RepID=A0A4R6TU54_9BACI|nr:polyprenyl synthetase family protein [Aureibacillus halotolerans]TDQ36102.1 competence protein ComQ [Aureibacillus halotolerans]